MVHFPQPEKRLQAIILCGPGVSFTTFASDPDNFPKALFQIANRPMVWYPLDLCSRMGIEDVTLIVPASSEHSIARALEMNTYLNLLPKHPKIVAPKELQPNTGTGTIFCLSEVKNLIKGDFIVLPCDLVCELNGPSLLNTWMVRQPWLDVDDTTGAVRGELSHKPRGGFTMWYDTMGENRIKGEETDFMMTAPFEKRSMYHKGSILTSTSKLVVSMPTDTLNDTIEENGESFPIRNAAVRTHPRIRMLTQHRDTHLYIFPAWIVGLINARPKQMESLSEDVIGWWAKMGWQKGLEHKFDLQNILKGVSSTENKPSSKATQVTRPVKFAGVEEKEEDDEATSTNISSKLESDETTEIPSSPDSEEKPDSVDEKLHPVDKGPVAVPPIIAYVHPSYEGTPLVRRVDTAPLLLSISLRIAKLEPIEAVGKNEASPFAHQSKIGFKCDISTRCNISKSDSLIGNRVIVEEKATIKESIIGSNCQIHAQAKLLRCVLMDGVVVKRGSKLTDCVIGRDAVIGENCILTECEVQNAHTVEPKTEEKGEKIMSSSGLEAGDEDFVSGEEDEEDEKEDDE